MLLVPGEGPRARLSRRDVLRRALGGAGLLLAGPILGVGRNRALGAAADLGAPDANGVRLLPGFRARVVARSGRPPVPGGAYIWHGSPDGGACFPTADGGWVYASNSELPYGAGGTGALRFDGRGQLVDAYRILSGTSLNCSGGATPWGTWLSCEEHPFGSVWECDPLGAAPAEVRPALGRFTHEAVAIDQAAGRLYLSEDTPQGRLYRFTPVTPVRAGRFTLSDGVLEVAEVVGGIEGAVRWHAVPDPHATAVPTALQVPASTAFAGGEGIAWHRGRVYLCTKLDNRVWLYDTARESLRILYDDDRHDEPVLTGVDGLAITAGGQVLVAEDEGDMQIVALRADGGVDPIVQVVGHRDSEIAGPAFDPSGTRLYFSSQRGPDGGLDQGITYEVCGPFAAG
jgi:hypothetical protein